LDERGEGYLLGKEIIPIAWFSSRVNILAYQLKQNGLIGYQSGK
jgi:hypothetical protein